MLPDVTTEADRKGRRISIRVSEDLHDQIMRLAKRDRRTVAGWVKIAIEDAVAAAGPAAKKK